LVLSFGGEERLEDSRLHLVGDGRTVIIEAHRQPVAAGIVGDGRSLGDDTEHGTSLAKSVLRIDQNVEEDLLELMRIRQNSWDAGTDREPREDPPCLDVTLSHRHRRREYIVYLEHQPLA